MSVSDISTLLEENMSLVVLSPLVSHGYLYHHTGVFDFLILSIISVPFAGFFLSVSYRLEAKEYVSKSDLHGRFMGDFLKTTVMAYITSVILALIGLYVNIQAGDLVITFLFLGNILLVSLIAIEWYMRNYFDSGNALEED